MDELKNQVKSHWEGETCGTRYGESNDQRRFYEETAAARYRLEPFIKDFADFPKSAGKRVLEVGIGGGADFLNWTGFASFAVGVDLTEAGTRHTQRRLDVCGISPERYSLLVCDAETLPFRDGAFDQAYSYGVLHHSPDTLRCFREVCRVLKPGGTLKAMIYHRPSWTGWLLWTRHALFAGKPFLTEKDVLFRHLESPGTKAYTRRDAHKMLRDAGFSNLKLTLRLAPGDTLNIKPSRKYQGLLYKIIWRLYPGKLIRSLGERLGLYLLIEGKKRE